MAAAALPRSAAGPNSPWLIAVIVSIATFMEVLDTTIANVALRHIAGALGASQQESTYITTSYLVSNAVIIPISGWLCNVVGRKRFYMTCVAIFTAASVACGLSTSLAMIVVCRVLQGVGGGGLAPVEQSIFADSFPPEKRAVAFSVYGLTIIAAPALGPVLGGLLTDNLSWQWAFFINLPVGLLSLVLTWFFVYDSPTLKEDRRRLLARGLRIDYLGFALLVVGFGALQVVLDRFEPDDGFSSSLVTSFAILSGAAIVALIVRELVIAEPIVNIRLLKNRAFAISNVVMFFFGFIISATTQLLPQLTQDLVGYDATTAGLTLGLGGFATIVFMPIAGLLTGRVVQPRWLVFGSLIGMGFALRVAAGLDIQSAFVDFSVSRISQVVWMPFVFIPLSAVQFIGIPDGKNNEASAIINMVRNIGGSIGLAVATTMLSWRGQFHYERLAEHITASKGYSAGAALQSIARTVSSQSSIMSYLDIFTMLGFTALIVAPLALFLPKMPKGAALAH